MIVASLLRTFATAFATLTLVAGAAFALQTSALGRPARARVQLVKTLHELARYHQSHARVIVGGTVHSTECRQRWTGGRRDATVLVDGRTAVRQIGHHLADATSLSQTEFDLAGCPRALLTFLATALARGSAIERTDAIRDGVATYRLRVADARPPIDLYVDRANALPVAIELRGRHMRGASDLDYGLGRDG